MAALGVVVGLAGIGCGRDEPDDAVTAEAVDDATRSAERFRFVSEVDYADPQAVDPGSAIEAVSGGRAVGQVDLEAGYTWAGAPGGAPAVVVNHTQALLRSDLLPAAHRPSTAWVSFEGFSAVLPHLPDDLQGVLGLNGPDALGGPAEVTDMLKRYGATMEPDGEARVRGVDTTRYRVRFDRDQFHKAWLADFDAASAEAPDWADDSDFSREEFRKSVEKMDPPKTTVWVDEQARARRTEYVPVIADEESLAPTMRVELFDFGAAMDIARPAPDEITAAGTLNLPEPDDDLEEPADHGGEGEEAGDDIPDLAVPVRSRLSIRPVQSDEPGPCTTTGEPLFTGPGEDDQQRCYRLGPAALDRPMLTRAAVGSSGCEVEIHLAPDDASRFETITSESLGRRLALVLDGEVLSAPTVSAVIEGGEICISGGFDPGDAQRIVDRLTG